MLVPLVLVMAAGVVVIATEVKDGKRFLKNPPVLPTFFLENAGDFSPVFLFSLMDYFDYEYVINLL